MKTILPLLLCAALLLAGCASPLPGSGSVEDGITAITLSGDRASVRGAGASADGSLVLIYESGVYSVTGEFSDGQLLVDTGDQPLEVTVILDNARITNLSGPALYVRQAKDFSLQLASGSDNLLRSGEENWESADPNASGAALYAEDDLDIDGAGKLTVEGWLNNGIGCKNDIDLNYGDVIVTAVNHGVRAKNSIQIRGGSLSVSCLGDGLKTAEENREDKGWIEISDGKIQIEAWGDGIQAARELRISGGTLAVTARGDGSDGGSKALKAGLNLEISGGSLNLAALEDAVRSGGSVTVSGGNLELLSQAGDAIQAGTEATGAGLLRITGGQITVSQCRQALKGQEGVWLEGGSVLALCQTDKQTAPDRSDLGYLLCPFSGDEGDRILVEDRSVTAAGSFLFVFCADSSLVPGSRVPVSGPNGQVQSAVN